MDYPSQARKTVVTAVFRLFFKTLVILSLTPFPIHATATIPFALKWKQVETRYLTIYYHDGIRYSAQWIHEKGDAIFRGLCRTFEYCPNERIHVVLRDETVNANGFALPNFNHMQIWTTRLDLLSRAPVAGLRTVFTHELAHIISLKKAAALSPTMPAIGFRYQRNDGFSNFNIDGHLLLSGYNPASWWSEGVAELATDALEGNRWNTARDAFLQATFLHKAVLSYDQMRTVANKYGFDGERIYVQGYDFLRYLQQHAMFTLGDIAASQNKSLHMPWSNGLTLGQSPYQAYSGWVENRRQFYHQQHRQRRPFRLGQYVLTPIAKRNTKEQNTISIGSGEMQRRGQWLAWLGNGSPNTLYIAETDGNDTLTIEGKKRKRPKRVANVSDGRFSFCTDGSCIYVSKTARPYIQQGKPSVPDIYKIDLKTLKTKRITRHARATNPVISSDGNTLFFTRCYDMTCSLIRHDQDGEKVIIDNHSPANGRWISRLALSPNETKIAFTVADADSDRYDIGIYNRNHKTLQKIRMKTASMRSPCFLDANTLIVSSDAEQETYNLYRYNLQSGNSQRITQVDTAAFFPSCETSSRVIYGQLNAWGVNFRRLTIAPTTTTHQDSNRLTESKQLTTRKSVSPPAAMAAVPDSPYTFTLKPIVIAPSIDYFDNEIALSFDGIIEDHLSTVRILQSLRLSRDMMVRTDIQYLHLFPTLTLSLARSVSTSRIGIYTSSARIIEDNGFVPPLVGYRESRFINQFAMIRADFTFSPFFVLHAYLAYSDYAVTSTGFQEQFDVYRSLTASTQARFTNISGHPRFPRHGRISHFQFDVLRYLNTAPRYVPRIALSHTHFLPTFWNKKASLQLNINGAFAFKKLEALDQFSYYGARWQYGSHQHKRNYQGAGYDISSATGELRIGSSIGYAFPVIKNLAFTALVWHFDALYATVFTSAGNAWSNANDQFPDPRQRSLSNDAHLLVDVGIDFMLLGHIHNVHRWTSNLRIAYAFNRLVGSGDVNNDGFQALEEHVREVESPGFRILLSIGGNNND